MHLVTWSLALAGELLLFAASASIYTSTHYPFNSLHEEPLVDSATKWEALELSVDAVRVLLLTFLVGFYAIFRVQRSLKNKRISRNAPDSPTEATPLLNGDRDVDSERAVNGNDVHSPVNGNDVHSSANGTSPSEQGLNGHPNGICLGSRIGPAEESAFYRPTTEPSRSWWEYLKSFALFFPYLWPSSSTRLKVVFVVCFVLLLAQRVVNGLVPIQLGKVTNELSDHSSQMPWWSISLLVLFKLLQGSNGLINAVRAVLWIPISQYSYHALTTASFEHVHSLSLDFHLGKRTGEVISALSKGESINKFLEQVTFRVAPMIIDLGVAITYFYVAYDSYYALVVSLVSFWYLYLTIRMAQWRAEQRREQTNADREEDAVKNDSIMSYETVKYFNAERYEYDRYRGAVKTYQEAEAKVLWSLSVMNITQNAVFMAGLLVTSFISAWQVTKGIRTVGDFVTLLTYMNQLQQPLNFFGDYYRTVQQAMISGERLLELFKEQPTVIDEDDAKLLASCEGQIRFDNVRFSYDQRRTALQSLSFTCEPGTTTALVGESGGGKSTIFRLLFRFYNPQEGSIQIDGHDVRDVSIDSVRKHIGVVPQDTVLFNETLMYNLKYANQNATDEEVYNACRAASIHDKIMAFPDGYNTKVGERGLRLSGGEKQRVAIARTIIKNPRIIMLDEATAALDTETEQHIQEALTTLSNGRTMLVIA